MTPKLKDYAVVLVLLSVAVFFAHFLRFREFGIYEDDAWSVAAHFADPLGSLWTQTLYHFQHWHTGRPLNHLLPAVLGCIGYKLGGLETIYIIAALWLTLNSFLAYLIARRLLPAVPAFVTSIAYVLYPADTTKILLIHVAHVQGAMTFLLLGLLLWTAGGWWRRVGYFVGTLSLLTYETAYLPFICAPLLLVALNETRKLRVCLEHSAAVALTFGTITLIRLNTGDARATEAIGNTGQVLYRSITSLFIGPATSGASYLWANAIGYTHLDLPVLFVATILAGLTVIVALYLHTRDTFKNPNCTPYNHALRIAVAALITWAISYALTLTNYPPTQQMGRITSTHVAAAWPVALLIGSFAALVLTYSGRRLQLAKVGAAIVFLGLFAYHQFIQSEYVRAWRISKRFWAQIVQLAPDITPQSSIIIIGTPDLTHSRVIASNSWADGIMYERLFGLASDPHGPRFAHLGVLMDLVAFRQNGTQVEWRPNFWGGGFEPIHPAQLILFESNHGVLRRVDKVKVSIGELCATRPAPQAKTGTWPDSLVSRILQR